MFQSTHPRRVWHGLWKIYFLEQCFNPHTHAGCDSAILLVFVVWESFNPHTHAGCDTNNFPTGAYKFGFNPHTHAGCDQYNYAVDTTYDVSIHTPTQGVTELILPSTNSWKFQSTHPRRVWPQIAVSIRSLFMFQSTHPRRVWRLQTIWRCKCTKFQSTHPRRVWHTST